MLLHVPADLRAGAPLVVLLHGCGQDPARFAADGGWIDRADTHGFALLLPQQQAQNNHGRCFNWFSADDTGRDQGEALSIRQMVETATQRLGSGPANVAGLSAGGAMAAALLAAYPDVFAAGAVVAGLPVGCAGNVTEALTSMNRPDASPSPQEWANRVRAAGPPGFRGPWPRISIWHGKNDTTVVPANADLLIAQWTTLHGVVDSPRDAATPFMARRQIWGSAARPVVEAWTIPDMAHGLPVDATRPGGGQTGPWVLDAGISAADAILSFWGVAAITQATATAS